MSDAKSLISVSFSYAAQSKIYHPLTMADGMETHVCRSLEEAEEIKKSCEKKPAQDTFHWSGQRAWLLNVIAEISSKSCFFSSMSHPCKL